MQTNMAIARMIEKVEFLENESRWDESLSERAFYEGASCALRWVLTNSETFLADDEEELCLDVA